MKQLRQHCHATTLKGGEYSIVEDAILVTDGPLIRWIGPHTELPPDDYVERIDLDGAWLTPGLIDCHIHAVFDGNRNGEFEQCLKGVSYAEIVAASGGIVNTVRTTREANEEESLVGARKHLESLLRDGVTALEIKSGYGLDLASERKILRVIRRPGGHLPATVRSTCLAAHALPPEYTGRADDCIEHICSTMLPALAGGGLADVVDAFCEHLASSPAQVERVFTAARELGLPVKLHTEQLSSLYGSSLVVHYRALSVDHLEYMAEDDARVMDEAGTVAVLLSGAFYLLRETQLPSIDVLCQHGVAMAITGDLNPGTSLALSLRLMLSMACTLFRLIPEEALAGITLYAAQALGLEARRGSLEVGKLADFVAWDIERPTELAYQLGGDLPKHVIRYAEEVCRG